MILVDTNVWSSHFRRGEPTLAALLGQGAVAIHPWIVGELALGPGMQLDLVDDLRALPQLETVPDDELLTFIQRHRLRGIGWVDAQLVRAALEEGVPLWTRDRKLAETAHRFGVGYPDPD